ncbi:MAG: hypothetical protein WCG66_08115 [bacterium]
MSKKLPVSRPAPKPRPVKPSIRVETPQATLPQPVLSIAEQVGTRLGSSFVVTNNRANALSAQKSRGRSEGPALFEEAILLGKLRAVLKSSPAVGANGSVAFQSGEATVHFPASINSGTAAILISKMLALDGVNGVQAVFDN